MGTVYEASHLRVPRRFAVKILNRDVVGNRDIFDRFRREAEIASAIGNKHIVSVFDFNHADDGAPFMVLELLQGEDLARRLARVKRLTLTETASILDQTAGALEAAHAAGIVHRDLKPGNIFLIPDEDGEDFVKVLDFGISKVLHGLGADTRTGVVFGTPNYMAPEQAQGAAVDGRTDIFSLGTILYECLTGGLAFSAETPFATAYQVCHEPHKPMRTLAPELSADVERVVNRALAKRPSERFASALELRDAFFSACGLAIPATTRPHPVAAAPGAESVGPRTAMSAEARALLVPRRRRWGAVGVVSLALTAGLIWMVVVRGNGGGGEDPPARPPPPIEVPARAHVAAPPAAVATPVAAPAVDPAVEAPAPATVRIEVVVKPADAVVSLDGEVRADRPLVVPRSDELRRLSVTAPRHREAVREIRVDTDGRVEIELQPIGQSLRRPVRRSRPKRRVRGPVETDL
jgi:serine/threonine-protein kinase